jgi:hypothetical protein
MARRPWLLVVVILAQVAACHRPTNDARPLVVEWQENGIEFRETPLDAQRSLIEFVEVEPLSPVGSSMTHSLRAVQIAREKGYRYLEIGEVTPTGQRMGTYTLHFHDELPEGRRVFSLAEDMERSGGRRDGDAPALIDTAEIVERMGEFPPRPTTAPPPKPHTADVLGRLERSLFVVVDTPDQIRSIRQGRFDPAAPVELCVAGRSGASFVGLDGDVRAHVRFEERANSVEPVDVDGDGVYEFMNRGGGWSDVSLIDAKGQTLWTFPPAGADGPTPDDMAAGDLDGDGQTEFVVGTNAGGGVHVLDGEGRTLRVIEGVNVFSVAVLDTDGDGTREIVHSFGGSGPSTILVRTAGGDLVRRLEVGSSSFSILWNEDGTPSLLTSDDGGCSIHDFSGRAIRRHPTGRGGHAPHAVHVRLDASADAYLAVVRTIGATAGVSQLELFDPGGALVHREEFRHSRLAAAARSPGADAEQTLLVGAGNEVWEYTLRR